MARVKIEEILDSLSLEISKALEEAVRRKCSTWESVPDQYVEVDGR